MVIDMKRGKMHRGDVTMYSCETPYCSVIEGRCLLCGGVWSECDCGYCYYDGCICGGKLESWNQIRPSIMINYLKKIVRELYYGIRYGDWWYFKHGIFGE